MTLNFFCSKRFGQLLPNEGETLLPSPLASQLACMYLTFVGSYCTYMTLILPSLYLLCQLLSSLYVCMYLPRSQPAKPALLANQHNLYNLRTTHSHQQKLSGTIKHGLFTLLTLYLVMNGAAHATQGVVDFICSKRQESWCRCDL